MNNQTAPTPGRPAWVRTAHRDTEEPVLGGVAGGLAKHLGLAPTWVRGAFVVATFMGGFGLAVYAGLWIFMPAAPHLAPEAPGLAGASRDGRRPSRVRRLADAGPTLAVCVLGMGLLLGFDLLFGVGSWLWPLLIGFGGLALLWRQADEAQRARWVDSTGQVGPLKAVFGGGRPADYARVLAGLALLLVAVVLFSWRSGQGGVTRDVLLTVILAVVGLALVIGPWAVRLMADLGTEREERIRTQERADMAAHLHDSVLQTLALIQKNAADPAMVARLARAQERDLRTWLFESPGSDDKTLAGELREVGAWVEAEYDVQVDLVTVGDTPLTSGLRPLADAAREAVVNAAKHAGVERIDVFAEVTGAEVEVFVRDRGAGFDPESVPEDRRGVRGSIRDRMQRHGGTARVRSAPGEGTEVRLSMPVDEPAPATTGPPE